MPPNTPSPIVQPTVPAPPPPPPPIEVPMTHSSVMPVLLSVVLTLLIVVGVVGLAWSADLISFAPPLSEESESSTTMEENTEIPPMTLSVGTYALVGKGAGQAENYSGTITIAKRGTTANVYDLVWHITSGQTQNGVGILTDDVLSVSYYEASGDTLADIGVVSYKIINESYLVGEWTSVQGGSAGEEQLRLQQQI